MKAGIITLYNSENCGSFWQAFALQEYLKMQEIDVHFLYRDVKGTSHSKKSMYKNIIKSLIKRDVKAANEFVRRYKAYEDVQKNFKIIYNIDEDIDIWIIGSDTVWELNDAYFAENRSFFWGMNIDNNKLISYAPSIANATLDDIKKYPDVLNSLNTIYKISVRDKNSYDVLSSSVDREIYMVCDPTLLFKKEFYLNYSKKVSFDDYILIYYFGNMPNELKMKIVKFANQNNLEILSFNDSIGKLGKKVDFEPMLFVSLFANAKYVITNTFHGTMFSLIFEKQAVFNSLGKEKVKDIVSRLSLEKYDYANNREKIELFSEEIDYCRVSELIEKIRRDSKEYINKSIEGLK